MAIIRLTRGYETLIDDELYDDLAKYNWYASGNEGRPARRLKAGPRKLIYMYHQILHVLPWVINHMCLSVDHINRDPLDNRISNLRIVSLKVNARNTIRHEQAVGICFDNTHHKYKAYLDRPDLPRINIGTFFTREEAELALWKIKEELSLENN